MSEASAFKNRIDAPLIRRLSDETAAVYPAFDTAGFIAAATTGLSALELKARVDHVTRVWRCFLPETYRDALRIVLDTLGPPLDSESGWGDVIFYTWIHAHFVQLFGLDDPDRSLEAMVAITQRGSCEFAVRPYLEQHRTQTLAFLNKQLRHPSAHVRRWVSEGCRPRLPWGKRLDAFVADPSSNLSLLYALRKDRSRYVRTSVANHLGDIAKDHPDRAITEVRAWLDEGFDGAEWIAKKSLSHLIKKGDPGALRTLGFRTDTKAVLRNFEIDKPRLTVGESLTFTFSLTGTRSEKLSIDYAVEHPGATGKLRRKVFKLSVRDIADGETLTFKKRHSMRIVTTRTYYPGTHHIVIRVNGVPLCREPFELTL